MTNTHPYLNNLTALRGIAALWIVLFHLNGATDNVQLPHLTMLIGNGYLMVDLFFIMSGFIIMYVYGDGFSRQITKPGLNQFIIARFARIYPLHLFTLVLLVADRWLSNDWSTLSDPATIPIHILLLQSFGLQKALTWNGPSWSISAEWWVCMLFPLMALFFHQKPRMANLVFFIIMAASYLFLLSRSGPIDITHPQRWLRYSMDISIDYGFLRGVGGFILGILIFGVYANGRARNFFSTDIVAYGMIVITLFCLHKDISDLLSVITFAGLVLSFAANKGSLHRLCSFRPLQFLGKISYSIYLMQSIVLHFFLIGLRSHAFGSGFPFPDTLFFRFLYQVGFLLILTGVATITYFGVENPCRNFIHRMAKPSSPSTSSAK
jgi:peptidoglycan/LPS O-acetylase OafA/YrhL